MTTLTLQFRKVEIIDKASKYELRDIQTSSGVNFRLVGKYPKP